MTNELLPCPFCASVELIDDGYRIECKHCSGKSGFRTSYHRKAWNSRATPADPALDPEQRAKWFDAFGDSLFDGRTVAKEIRAAIRAARAWTDKHDKGETK